VNNNENSGRLALWHTSCSLEGKQKRYGISKAGIRHSMCMEQGGDGKVESQVDGRVKVET
jgi:hypothetical protein